MSDKPMYCPLCGNDMTDDYFIMDLKRIKDGVPSYALPIFLCLDCYEALRLEGNKPFRREDL